jgi:hypothetical protein
LLCSLRPAWLRIQPVGVPMLGWVACGCINARPTRALLKTVFSIEMCSCILMPTILTRDLAVASFNAASGLALVRYSQIHVDAAGAD